MSSPPILDLDSDETDEVEPIFELTKPESGKRKLNGLSNGLDSPSKKVAISSFVYFDEKTDYETEQIDQELFNVDVVDQQSTDTNKYELPSTTTPLTTPTQSPSPIAVNSETPTTPTPTTTPTPPTTTTTTNMGHACLWYMCEIGTNFPTAELLYDHILSDHVEPCEGQEVYMCQWERCKVYNIPSSSYNGYRGHVLAHTKAKMYRCLISDCPSSFRTREGE